jgi:TonB family protein
MSRVCFGLLILFTAAQLSSAQSLKSSLTVAVVDFGESAVARKSTDTVRESLKLGALSVLDPELVRAAAKGIGYSGNLNLSVVEAREIGAAISSDFFVVGDAQTLRRTSSQMPVYFESYCSIFVVSSRTGRLIFWDRPSVEDLNNTKAEQLLLHQLATNENRDRWVKSIEAAEQQERAQRASDFQDVPIIEAPDDEQKAAAQGLQLPKPYRRFRPEYPTTAARADVEATVDVLVDVDSEGEVGSVEVVRWAGFGLDEATIATVKRLHFFPAKSSGVAIPMRVMLRYNFRKSAE